MKFLDTAKKSATVTINTAGEWFRKDQKPMGNDYFTIILVVVVNLMALGAGLFVGYFFGISAR